MEGQTAESRDGAKSELTYSEIGYQLAAARLNDEPCC